MRVTTKRWLGRVLATSALAGAVAVPLGMGSAGAAPSAAFCSTLLHAPKTTTPSVSNVTAYRAWAKVELAFFQKLKAEAPDSATRNLFSAVVTYLQYGAGATSAKALAAYELTHEKQWAQGLKTLSKDALACVESMSQ